jgi:hypothetical protein
VECIPKLRSKCTPFASHINPRIGIPERRKILADAERAIRERAGLPGLKQRNNVRHAAAVCQ